MTSNTRVGGALAWIAAVVYIVATLVPAFAVVVVPLDSKELYESRFIADGGFTITRRRFNYTLTLASVQEIDEFGSTAGSPIELTPSSAHSVYTDPLTSEYRVRGDTDELVRKTTKIHDSSSTPGIPIGASITIDSLIAMKTKGPFKYEYSAFESQYIYDNELAMIVTIRDWFTSDFAARVDNHVCLTFRIDGIAPIMARRRFAPVVAHKEVVKPLSIRTTRPVAPESWTLTPNNTEITLAKSVIDTSFDFVALRDRLFLRDTPPVVTVDIAKVVLRDPMIVDSHRRPTLASAPKIDGSAAARDETFTPTSASSSIPIHVCLPYFQKTAIYKVSFMPSDVADTNHSSWFLWIWLSVSLACTVVPYLTILFLF